MSGFSATWLGRREPYDRRARSAAVLKAVAAFLAARPALSIVDLASGTGATLRAIAGALPGRQDWRLVDNDLSLLARGPVSDGRGGVVRAVPLDLAHDLEAVLDGPVDLVTTSAFLDLVSAEWLERLVTEIAARGLPFYAALSVDGRIALYPPDDADEAVIAAFKRHQCTDKGFGLALGPAAAAAAIALFERIGYVVVQGPSDWVLGPDDGLQAELLEGMAGTALQRGGLSRKAVEGWMMRRGTMLAAQRSRLTVGHVDFFARPGASSGAAGPGSPQEP